MKRYTSFTPHRTAITAALALLAAGPHVGAQDTHVWNDPNGGVWGTFTKWTPTGVPSSLDVARFDLNADYTVSFVNGGQARLLQVLDGDVIFEGSGISAGDRTLAVEDALFNTNADVILRPNSNGKNLTLSTSDDIAVRGSLTVSSGAKLENISAVVDSAASNSRAQVVINGVSSGGEPSKWTATSLDVGTTDFADVRVEDGGFVQISGPTVLGNQSGSEGVLEVTGRTGITESEFRTTETIIIGESGNGILRIDDGGRAATEGAILGDAASGRGSVTIENNNIGDASFWFAGALNIDRGDVVVNSGGSLRTTATAIGNDATSSVTVSGTGSGSTLGSWEAYGTTTIGHSAAGTLDIEQGGRAVAVIVNVGRESGGVGRINVSSSNPAEESRWVQTDNLYLGGDASGSGGVGHLNLITNSFARIDGTVTIYEDSSVVMGPNSTLIAPTIENDNSGFFDFLRGTLHTNSYTGNLINQEGTLAPYRSSSLTGDGAGDTVIHGNYTQQAGATLAIDLIDDSGCGIGYDHLEVTGDALLGGELELTLAEGFIPNALSSFNIISADNLSGVFANAAPGQRLETTDGLGSFLVNYGVTSPFSADTVILSNFLALVADLAGDYNGTGLVEQGDLDLVLQNWGDGFAGLPAAWVEQRPTSGIVDQAELDGVLQNWGSAAAPDFRGSAVPEPASLALIGMGALCLKPLRRFAR